MSDYDSGIKRLKSDVSELRPDIITKEDLDQFEADMIAAVYPSSKGAKKYDQDKPMLALIPAEAIEEEGLVWTFGAKKYGNYNWLGGLTYLRILSALLRHAFAIVRGEDRDPESGLLHAAHVRACAGMLITFSKQNRTDLDDRYKK